MFPFMLSIETAGMGIQASASSVLNATLGKPLRQGGAHWYSRGWSWALIAGRLSPRGWGGGMERGVVKRGKKLCVYYCSSLLELFLFLTKVIFIFTSSLCS